MNGKELQLKIRKAGKKQNQLAREMGMDPSQWTAIFKQEDVKSGIVEQVAQLLGMSIGHFYGEGDSISADNNSMAFKGTNTCDPRLLDIIQARDRALERSQHQLDKSQEQIDKLISIIQEKR